MDAYYYRTDLLPLDGLLYEWFTYILLYACCTVRMVAVLHACWDCMDGWIVYGYCSYPFAVVDETSTGERGAVWTAAPPDGWKVNNDDMASGGERIKTLHTHCSLATTLAPSWIYSVARESRPRSRGSVCVVRVRFMLFTFPFSSSLLVDLLLTAHRHG